MRTGMRVALAIAVLVAFTFIGTAQPVSAADKDTNIYLPMMGMSDTEIVASADDYGPTDDTYDGVALEIGYLEKGDFAPSDPCAAFGYDLAFKIDGVPSDQAYSGNGWEIKIIGATDDTFGWEAVNGVAGQSISAVIIKAGTGANYYDYRRSAPSADEGLHTPGFEKKGDFTYRQISNFSFCTVGSEPGVEPG